LAIFQKELKKSQGSLKKAKNYKFGLKKSQTGNTGLTREGKRKP